MYVEKIFAKRRFWVLLLLFALNVNQAQAQFWKPFTDAAGSVVNTGIRLSRPRLKL